MAKIFFYIFNIILIVAPLYSSEKGRLTKELRSKTYQLFKDGKYSESIPYLEKYLEIQPAEIYMRLVYAQALLMKEDLPIPSREEDNYTRAEKWKTIKRNYGQSAKLFEEKRKFSAKKKFTLQCNIGFTLIFFCFFFCFFRPFFSTTIPFLLCIFLPFF
jgi:hypothetical protein